MPTNIKCISILHPTMLLNPTNDSSEKIDEDHPKNPGFIKDEEKTPTRD